MTAAAGISACFLIDAGDNVATLLGDVLPGPVAVVGSTEEIVVEAREPIKLGHKIAVRAIAQGESVSKYGVSIGLASKPIEPGQWVHLHNLASHFDARSQTLDLHTGGATDTKYE